MSRCSLEVDHIPERYSPYRQRVRLKHHGFKMNLEDFPPMGGGSRVLAPVPACKGTCNAGSFGKDQIEDVYVPTLVEKCAKVP